MESLVVMQLNRTRVFIADDYTDYELLVWNENGLGMELGVCQSLVTKRSQGPMVMVYRNSGGTVARAVATDPYICPIYMHISVYHGCVSD